MTTLELLAAVNTLRAAANDKPLKSWKGSKAALQAMHDALALMPTPAQQQQAKAKGADAASHTAEPSADELDADLAEMDAQDDADYAENAADAGEPISYEDAKAIVDSAVAPEAITYNVRMMVERLGIDGRDIRRALRAMHGTLPAGVTGWSWPTLEAFDAEAKAVADRIAANAKQKAKAK